nr:hypothetical protein [Tanacetum cinerariifolium]
MAPTTKDVMVIGGSSGRSTDDQGVVSDVMKQFMSELVDNKLARINQILDNLVGQITSLSGSQQGRKNSDTTNNNTTNNVAQNNLPQLLDSRGGSHVTNVLEFDKKDFTSWKVSDFNVKEDLRSSSEFITDLNNEFNERALLSNQKRFYKWSGRVRSERKRVYKSNEKCFAYGKQGHFQKESAESSDSDEESMFFDDEGVTKVKAYMAIVEDELSVGKADALGGKCKRKEKISLKEVIFMKDDESSSVSVPDNTFDSVSECLNQEPLPSFSKPIEAKPTHTSKSLMSSADLTLNMADLTLNMADLTLNTNVP